MSHTARTLDDIPRVPRLPIIGNAIELRLHRLELFDRIYREHGPIARVALGQAEVVVITDGDFAHQVLVTDADAYVKSRTLGEFARPFLGDGLLTSEGERHALQRRRMTSVFPHARVVGWVDLMANRAEQTQAGWIDGQTIDVAAAMMELTLGIVTETLFGSDVPGDAAEIGEAFERANSYVAIQAVRAVRPPRWLPTPGAYRNRAAIRHLNEIVYRLIESRRRIPEARADLLSILIDLEGATEGQMTTTEVRDEVMTLMFAGHETTANALGWMWLLLSRNPSAASALRAEADGVLGGRTPTMADLATLPYALQVFKESLRLYPPVWFIGRIATRAVIVGGYALPVGTTLGVNIWGINRRADLFPEPTRFDPSRFERDREKSLPKTSLVSFGAGPRVCIGNQFAMVEGQVLAATLAQRVELDVDPAVQVRPEPLITLRQRGGLRASVRRRSVGPGRANP